MSEITPGTFWIGNRNLQSFLDVLVQIQNKWSSLHVKVSPTDSSGFIFFIEETNEDSEDAENWIRKFIRINF